MAHSNIHQLVYPRHGKRVFGARFVQMCEVHTHPPLSILFLYYHCIGQPLRVENFLNSLRLLKLIQLFLDNIIMLFR